MSGDLVHGGEPWRKQEWSSVSLCPLCKTVEDGGEDTLNETVVTTPPLGTGLAQREGWAGHESIPEVTTAPSGCHSNRNPYSYLLFNSPVTPSTHCSNMFLYMSSVLCLCVCGRGWYITEAEEHRRSAGFLDGQRLRAAQLHQAGPRPESYHAGRPGHPRSSSSDGFQVSLCVVVLGDVGLALESGISWKF